MGNGRAARRTALVILLAGAATGCDDGGRDAYEEATRLVRGMDLPSRTAQLVLPRLAAGGDSVAVSAQARAAAEGRLAGVWVDDGDARAVASRIAALRRVSRLPLLVAGPIDRGMPLRGGTRLPSTSMVARLASPRDAREAGALAAREARAVGIDLGFVAVPPTNGSGPLTYAARAPTVTGESLRPLVEAARAEGLSVGVFALWAERVPDPLLTWDRARLEAVELAILRETLAGEPEAVGLGPLRLPAITGDSTALPVSGAAIRGLLRRDLGYGGLVVANLSRDAAIAAQDGIAEAAVRSLAAGADLLIRVDDAREVIGAIVAAVEAGRLRPDVVDSAAVRVLAARIRAPAPAPVAPDSLAPVLQDTEALALARRLEAAVAAPVLPAPAPVLRAARSAAAMDSVGVDSTLLARVDRVLRQALDDSVFTAAAITVARRGRLLSLTGYGEGVDPATTIFDVASLTKVLGTATAVALLVESGDMQLDAPLRRYIPEWRGDDKEDVTLRHLLTHTSGLPSGLWLFGSARAPEQALRQTLEQPLMREPGEAAEYSDLGMILLAEAAERAAGMPLDRFLALRVYAPLGMQRTMFLPPIALAGDVVPTALTAERDFVLRGVVHDANAFRLGGVAGHAGLFSSAPDLAVFTQMVLNGGSYGATHILSPPTLTAFTTRQQNADTRALGWDTPAERSSAGRLFSASSYGHTGYTGTSIWIDPELDLFVVLLTNRTYTDATSSDIRALRAAVHDAVAGAVSDETVRPRPGSRAVN